MCINCLTKVDQIAGEVALTIAVLRTPVHRALAELGLADAPDPIRTDVRTVVYLRALGLDPVEFLGADVVSAADTWVAPVRARRRSWAPAGRPAAAMA